MNVLILTPYYLPGFKAGGPIRSLANLVAELGREISFRVITRDRDLGDAAPYSGINFSAWRSVGNARVAYLGRRRFMPNEFARRIREVEADVIYINSIFDPRFCALPLLLRRSRLIAQRPLIIAPRGAFSRGALAMKRWKKVPYLNAIRLGLPRDLVWHATSELERQDILRTIGPRSNVVLAPNLCHASDYKPGSCPPKQSGQLNLAFFARISPMKNLLAAIRMVQQLPRPVSLDIWGPIEDANYWRHCQAETGRHARLTKVVYRGALLPDQITATLSRYDAMLLPTLGENHGHAILESLAAGCPVIISDRTPWRNLNESSAGWDLPLENEAAFVRALSRLADMDEVEYRQFRNGARTYFEATVDHARNVQLSRALFQIAAGQRSLAATTLPQRTAA
jgi:glycosyltransferase involved in cell wall biosynthesis